MIRRACVIAALLGLFLQGSSAVHMLLVAHVRCAEHGELIHATEPRDRGSIAHTRTDRAAVEGMRHGSSEAGHAHCPLSSQRREVLTRVLRAAVGLALRSPAPAWTILGQQHGSDGPSRFRVAPKNSPPA